MRSLFKRYPQSWQAILLGLLFLSLGQHSIPVLDEESYWKIADQMSWSRPYDWKMPWFPFEEQGFVYAHPPLFLFWVKFVQSWFDISLAQWILGIPLQILFLYSIDQFFQRFLRPQNYWFALILLLLSAGVYLPLSRSLMPDLMMLSFASFAMWRWFSAENTKQYLFAGFVLGLASWVKYPALVLFLLPLLSARKKGSFLWFGLGGGCIFLLGEAWLWSLYGDVHLWEVIRRAPEIPRSSFASRGIGILNRLGLSLFPLTLLLLFQMTKRSWIFGGLGAGLSFFYAQYLGLEHSWLAIIFGCLGGCTLSSIRLNSVWSFWALLILLGVWIGHNYASPRYWVLISFPLLIQEIRGLELETRHWGIIFPAMILSFLIIQAEQRHARESIELAERIHQQETSIPFTGEWSFRWKMEALGHPFIENQKPDSVIWARNSAGGVDASEYQFVEKIEGNKNWFGLVNSRYSVGYYADSLGFWPVWIGSEPLEVVEIWKK